MQRSKSDIDMVLEIDWYLIATSFLRNGDSTFNTENRHYKVTRFLSYLLSLILRKIRGEKKGGEAVREKKSDSLDRPRHYARSLGFLVLSVGLSARCKSGLSQCVRREAIFTKSYLLNFPSIYVRFSLLISFFLSISSFFLQRLTSPNGLLMIAITAIHRQATLIKG